MRAFLSWITGRTTVSTQLKTDPMLVVKRVWIERNECTSMTMCESESAGLIEYSKEHGASVVKDHALQRTQGELKLLLEASSVCGMSAFYLETVDGRVLNLDDHEIQKALAEGTYRWA